MFLDRRIVCGKLWIESQTLTICQEDGAELVTTSWTVVTTDTPPVHWLHLSSEGRSVTVGFRSSAVSAVNKDPYIQKRIRYKLRRTLRALLDKV